MDWSHGPWLWNDRTTTENSGLLQLSLITSQFFCSALPLAAEIARFLAARLVLMSLSSETLSEVACSFLLARTFNTTVLVLLH